jgi:hypothetical protein
MKMSPLPVCGPCVKPVLMCFPPPNSSPERVLERAVAADAILVTFDADFGGLIYQQGLQRPLGILYLRFSPAHPLEPAELLLELLKTDLVLIGFMTVLERDGLRQRPL